MPVVNVNLYVDEKTYAGVMSGAFELCGMAKNIKNHRVVKHIPTVVDAAKEGGAKAIDIIREYRKGAFLIGGFLVVGGAVAGTVGYIRNKGKRKLEIQFAKALQEYLDAAKEGKLTSEILDSLNSSLDAILKENSVNPVDLKISSSQFSELINAVFDYTQRLAKANNIGTESINRPKILKKKNYTDLQYYLNMQKYIFEQVA